MSKPMSKKVSLEAIRTLREQTGASLKDVREALETAHGDKVKAIEYLLRRGAQIAEKRAGRATGDGRGQGRVESYIHHDGRLGSLVEVHCETDFVARTQEFIQFCRDVAMQVAAMSPRYIQKEDVPSNAGAASEEFRTVCLLEQPFVKDQQVRISDLMKVLIAKVGEKVVIKRFARFAVGEPPIICTP